MSSSTVECLCNSANIQVGAFSVPPTPPPPLAVTALNPFLAHLELQFLPNFFNTSSSWENGFLRQTTETLSTLLNIPFGDIDNITIVNILHPAFTTNASNITGQGSLVVSVYVMATQAYNYSTTDVAAALQSLIKIHAVQFNYPPATPAYIVGSVTLMSSSSSSNDTLSRSALLAIIIVPIIVFILLIIAIVFSRCNLAAKQSGRKSPSSKSQPAPTASPSANFPIAPATGTKSSTELQTFNTTVESWASTPALHKTDTISSTSKVALLTGMEIRLREYRGKMTHISIIKYLYFDISYIIYLFILLYFTFHE